MQNKTRTINKRPVGKSDPVLFPSLYIPVNDGWEGGADPDGGGAEGTLESIQGEPGVGCRDPDGWLGGFQGQVPAVAYEGGRGVPGIQSH